MEVLVFFALSVLPFPGLTRRKKEKQKTPGFLRLASGSNSIWIPFPVQPELSADGCTHTCSCHALAPLRSNKIPPLQPPDQILNCSAHSGWFTADKDRTQPETKRGKSFTLWLNLQLNNSTFSLKFLQVKMIHLHTCYSGKLQQHHHPKDLAWWKPFCATG